MAVKSNFAAGDVLTASNVNTYLTNGGLVYITETIVTAGSSATLSFNNVFSSTYDNYRIMIDGYQPSAALQALNFRLRVGGVDASGADYYYSFVGNYVDGTSTATIGSAVTSGTTGIYNSTNSLNIANASIDVIRPYKAERTFFTCSGSLYNSQFGSRFGMNEHNLTTSYDGFTLFNSASGNITKITVRVYGYRQA